MSDDAEVVEYGDLPDQFGELTRPSGEPRGLVVVVHGGFWKPEYGIEYARPLVPDLVEEGSVDAMVRAAIASGVAPVTALRMATLNVAEHFGLKDRGLIAPGRVADGNAVPPSQTPHGRRPRRSTACRRNRRSAPQ